MRRILLIVVLMAFAAVACGGGEGPSFEDSTPGLSVNAQTPEPDATADDTGFVEPDNQEPTVPIIQGDGTYGSNELLDGFYDDCLARDMQACDKLYLASPAGSEYEALAQTCGETGRSGIVGTCEALSEDDPIAGELNPQFEVIETLGDDPILDGLWGTCEVGDRETCDKLYFAAPVNSDYENFGSTCGRTEAETFGGCDGPSGPGAVAVNQTYGDNGGLDSLHDACGQGIFDACDDLYSFAAPDTDYANFGRTCGGVPPEGFGNCAGLQDTDEGLDFAANNIGDDPGYDTLYVACREGVFDACDELFSVAPLDSAYEAFAMTCGERRASSVARCI